MLDKFLSSTLAMWAFLSVISLITYFLGLSTSGLFFVILKIIFLYPVLSYGIADDGLPKAYGFLSDFLKEKFNA